MLPTNKATNHNNQCAAHHVKRKPANLESDWRDFIIDREVFRGTARGDVPGDAVECCENLFVELGFPAPKDSMGFEPDDIPKAKMPKNCVSANLSI